ncbi:MAG: aminoglycoside phosphotransferase family protein [Asgard group archaeon]|nr:aminoglycoside phosphotransferase family protein [Asgard group archaeon]
MNNDLISKNLQDYFFKEFGKENVISIEQKANKTINLIYKCITKKANFYAKILVRQPKRKNEYFRLEKEASLYKQLRHFNKTQGLSKEEQYFIPVPEVYDILIDEEIIGYKTLILSELSGENLDLIWFNLSSKHQKDILLQLALIIKQLHTIEYDLFGDIENYDSPRQFFSFKSLLKANLRKYITILSKNKFLSIKLLTEIELVLEKALKKQSFHWSPILVHDDLNPSNFMIKKEKTSWKISGFFDFEWAYAGIPLTDLYRLRDNFSLTNEQERIFLRKYGLDINYLDEKFREQILILQIIQLLESLAIGWISFHPTDENLLYAKKRLVEIKEKLS